MAITFVLINQKGGVGKSSAAFALATGLPLKGKKVLAIDMDSQGNLTSAMRGKIDGITVLDVLAKGAPIADAVQQTESGTIVPSHPSLAAADIMITSTGKEFRLKEAIEPIKNDYDFIIIDTPPGLGILTVNSLSAADECIIPSNGEAFSLQGINQLYSTIDAVRKYCNPSLKVRGVLMTFFKSTILFRDMTKVIEKHAQAFNAKLFKATIRSSVTVGESNAKAVSIFKYAPKSPAAADYMNFVNEVLKGR